MTHRKRSGMLSRRDVLALIATSSAGLRAAQSTSVADFRRLAPTPPMGWNSWDSFGPTIHEEAARANAAVMARKLLPHGYDIFTIDIQWYEPNASSYEYRRGAELTMDQWGRLLPAANRFPSAANGAGFKPLAHYVHSLGLKFGLHMLRGVPRQAADRNTPIVESRYRAGDIADRTNVCLWNSDMYGIDMSKRGAQEYYDSVLALYASWGVDFIKADDMSRQYLRNQAEIHALRRALDRCGRPMILSLSPGETPLDAAADAAQNANLWRISDDFWDTWPALKGQFERLRNWSAHRREGNWPDADMLPLGVLDMGRRKTRLTAAEQVTLMTLWSIARSPLFMGGDLTQLDDFTLSLLTNDAVLAVNQASEDNRQIFHSDGLAAWQARPAHGADTYLALFNLRDPTPVLVDAPITIRLADLGLSGRVHILDLWRPSAQDTVRDFIAPQVPAHGARLFRLSPV
ncbi:MAG: glycoside hydrolase family 27 protein [Gammaproteobacteria bacterium]